MTHRLISTVLALALFGGCQCSTEETPKSEESDAATTVDSGDGSSPDGGSEMNGEATNCEEELPPPRDVIDLRGQSTATVIEADDCSRSYRIESNAPRRDDQPPSPRVVAELPDWPKLRSGDAMLDALYAMTLEEVRQNSVDEISNGGFRDGQPLPCEEGGCFETGEEWTYVWTRDISYATALGLAELDPRRAANSLAFKVSPPRGGGDEQVMQDTGTGGSYPVSTDRVVWALGARAVAMQRSGQDAIDYASWAFDVLRATLEHDRALIVDERTGLYFGEQSFLDWREQSYPAWVAGDPVHIATSRASNTNLLHMRAMQIAVELAEIAGRSAEAAEIAGWAEELRDAIATNFWNDEVGLYATYFATYLDEAPSAQYDLLGNALAIEFGVAGERQAERMLSTYPLTTFGAPVIMPQQQFTPIYHNRADWPFVSAYWLRAASTGGSGAVGRHMFYDLVSAAAHNLSNMENLEAMSGLAWVEDGDYSGPVVNSRRQLWSVAGFVSLVHRTMFGLRPDWSDGPVLRVAPKIPTSLVADWLGGREEIELRGYRYQGLTLDISLVIPPGAGGRFLVPASIEVDGTAATSPLALEDLADGAKIRVVLRGEGGGDDPVRRVTDQDWRDFFAPKIPRLTVTKVNDLNRLTWESGDHDEGMLYSVWRNGEPIATFLDEREWTDQALPTGPSPCYVVRGCFTGSLNCSQPSEPVCVWDAIEVRDASTFEASGGTIGDSLGRNHWAGGAGDGIVVRDVKPGRSGAQLLQLEYGNEGPVESGITCALAEVRVFDQATGADVGGGVFTLPHLGDASNWSYSSFVPIELDAERSYRLEISFDGPSTRNMSNFVHFAAYTGGPGGLEPRNSARISEVRILSK